MSMHQRAQTYSSWVLNSYTFIAPKWRFLQKNSKIASLISCQRSDLRKTLKYSQSRDLEGIQSIHWIYTDAATPPLVCSRIMQADVSPLDLLKCIQVFFTRWSKSMVADVTHHQDKYNEDDLADELCTAGCNHFYRSWSFNLIFFCPFYRPTPCRAQYNMHANYVLS